MEEEDVGWACRTRKKMKNAYKILVGKPERMMGDRSISTYARMILKRMLKKLCLRLLTAFIGP
jgi:hypothetical protein